MNQRHSNNRNKHRSRPRHPAENLRADTYVAHIFDPQARGKVTGHQDEFVIVNWRDGPTDQLCIFDELVDLSPKSSNFRDKKNFKKHKKPSKFNNSNYGDSE